MTNDQRIDIVNEIVDFCLEEHIFDYRPLREYAKEHNKTDWIECLQHKPTRRTILELQKTHRAQIWKQKRGE